MSDFVVRDKFTGIASLAALNPPSWTRLEPVTATGDPRPSLEARLHDPLWLLCRQWQLGEFAGEDAGTPLTVHLVSRTRAVDRWADAAGVVSPLSSEEHDLLEPRVEREPVPVGASVAGARQRIEAGSVLMAAIDDAGLGGFRTAFLTMCSFDFANAVGLPGDGQKDMDPEWGRLQRLLEGRPVLDGEAVARAVEAAAPDLPPWLEPADGEEENAIARALSLWLGWYRSEIAPFPGGPGCWDDRRLDYVFEVGADDASFVARGHRGGAIDWYSFDKSDALLAQPDGRDPPEQPEPAQHTVLATPLRYPGMPADRLWELEDGRVNLGLVEAEPWDLARLLVAEFALTYGNDWLVVPLDVPFGSHASIESVVYLTNFGERFLVKPTVETRPDGHWQMFTHEAAAPADSGLLLPPSAVSVQDGPPIEDVMFLRDEMANLCWAIERAVQGPSGKARDRSREADPTPPGQGPVVDAELDYQLQMGVPARWIPYLPRSTQYAAIELVQGAVQAAAAGEPTAGPLGRLLNSPGLKTIVNAEIPREGLNLQRRPSMMRLANGAYACWISRHFAIGRGEGASRLRFDSAISRRARPKP